MGWNEAAVEGDCSFPFCNTFVIFASFEMRIWFFFLSDLIGTISILYHDFMSSAFQPWKKLKQNYLTWKPNMMKKLLPSKSLPISLCPCAFGQGAPSIAHPWKISLLRPPVDWLCKEVHGLEDTWPLSCYKEQSVVSMTSLHKFKTQDVTVSCVWCSQDSPSNWHFFS